MVQIRKTKIRHPQTRIFFCGSLFWAPWDVKFNFCNINLMNMYNQDKINFININSHHQDYRTLTLSTMLINFIIRCQANKTSTLTFYLRCKISSTTYLNNQKDLITNSIISHLGLWHSCFAYCSMYKNTQLGLCLHSLRGLIWLDHICHFGHSLRNQNM